MNSNEKSCFLVTVKEIRLGSRRCLEDHGKRVQEKNKIETWVSEYLSGEKSACFGHEIRG